MNSWSSRRKTIIFFIVLSFLLVLVGGPTFFFFYKSPTCFDLKQNGNETGVDCGGSCELICSAESLPVIMKGDPRVIEIATSTYAVVVYAENPNATGEVEHAGYTLKLFEAGNVIPMQIIEGKTFIPKGAPFAIYEGPIHAGEAVPVRATFEWKSDAFVWKKNVSKTPELAVREKTLTRTETAPRLDARLVNNSLQNVSLIDVAAVVLDGNGNVIAGSKTFIETLAAGESAPLVFTWPAPFVVGEKVCEVPLDLALVIDRSGSMESLGKNPPEPLSSVKQAAEEFALQLRRNDQGALVTFAGSATNPIDNTLTPNTTELTDAINDIAVHADGIQETNIFDGLVRAEEELTSERHKNGSKQVIVLLTDGVPTQPTLAGQVDYPIAAALEKAKGIKEKGIDIYTIGLGGEINTSFLRSLATSPEYYFAAPTTGTLADAYQEIGVSLCKEKPAIVEVLPRILPDKSYLR